MAKKKLPVKKKKLKLAAELKQIAKKNNPATTNLNAIYEEAATDIAEKIRGVIKAMASRGLVAVEMESPYKIGELVEEYFRKEGVEVEVLTDTTWAMDWS